VLDAERARFARNGYEATGPPGADPDDLAKRTCGRTTIGRAPPRVESETPLPVNALLQLCF